MDIIIPAFIGAAIIIAGALYGCYGKKGRILVNKIEPLPYVVMIITTGIAVSIIAYFIITKLI